MNKYQLIGESIWNIYRSMAYVIAEVKTPGGQRRKSTVDPGPKVPRDPKDIKRLALQNQLSTAKTEGARVALRRQIAAL